MGRALGPDLNRIHPKGVLILGKVDGLSQRQLESFNHFRYRLSDLTVVTFDELLKRPQLLFGSDANPAQPSSSVDDSEIVSRGITRRTSTCGAQVAKDPRLIIHASSIRSVEIAVNREDLEGSPR